MPNWDRQHAEARGIPMAPIAVVAARHLDPNVADRLCSSCHTWASPVLPWPTNIALCYRLPVTGMAKEASQLDLHDLSRSLPRPSPSSKDRLADMQCSTGDHPTQVPRNTPRASASHLTGVYTARGGLRGRADHGRPQHDRA